jgi:hypothetical protein
MTMSLILVLSVVVEISCSNLLHLKQRFDMFVSSNSNKRGNNTARIRMIVGWVEALRNPTKPYKRWVSFLDPTYEF